MCVCVRVSVCECAREGEQHGFLEVDRHPQTGWDLGLQQQQERLPGPKSGGSGWGHSKGRGARRGRQAGAGGKQGRWLEGPAKRAWRHWEPPATAPPSPALPALCLFAPVPGPLGPPALLTLGDLLSTQVLMGGWLSPPSPAALMLSTPRAPKEWGDPISPRTGQRLRSSASPPSGPLAPGSACPWAARATVPEGSGGAQGTRRLSASLSGSAPSVWASRAWAPSGDLGAVLGMRPEFRVPSPLLCPFLPISAGGSWLLRQVEGPGPRSLGSG